MGLAELAGRYLHARQLEQAAGEALVQALVAILREVIPDIRGQLGWYDTDAPCLFSDSIAEDFSRSERFTSGEYEDLGDLIQKEAASLGIEMPYIDTPGVYLSPEEQQKVREVLRQALQAKR